MKDGDIPLPGEYPLSTRKKKRTIRRSWAELRKNSATSGSTMLSRRRHPGSRLHRGPRPISCRPMPGAPCRSNSKRSARALEAPTKPVIAIIGGAKVFHQDRPAGKSRQQGRCAGDRRQAMANTFLHAQGVGIGKSLAEKGFSRRQRCGLSRRLMRRIAPIIPPRRRRGGVFISRPIRRPMAYGLDAIPPDGMILDVGPAVRSSGFVPQSTMRQRWSGTARSARSRCPPFDRGHRAGGEARGGNGTRAKKTDFGRRAAATRVAALKSGWRGRQFPPMFSTAGGPRFS